MSQKSILSFFKQTELSNTNTKQLGVKTDSKNSNVESDSKKPSSASKKSSTKCDTEVPDTNSDSIEESTKQNGFKKSSIDKKAEKSINNDSNADSPIKQTKKRKRAKILESDDESQNSDELPSKKHEAYSEHTEVINGNHCNESIEKEDVDEAKLSIKVSEADPDKSIANGEQSSDGSSLLKIECMEEDQAMENVSESNNTKQLQSTENNLNTNIPLETLTSQSSFTAQETSLPGYIPKRKTARKQMRGGQQKKGLSKLPAMNAENENQTVNDDNKIVSEKLKIESSKEDIKGLDSDSKSCVSQDDKIKNKSLKRKNEVKELKQEIDDSEKAIEEQVSNIKVELCPDAETDTQDDQSEEKLPKKKPGADTNSKTKKPIHPFFASKKKEEASPQKDNTDKKAVKISSTTGTAYDPSKSRYHPIDDACWKRNEKVPYLALAKTLELIENISGRLKIVEILSNFLRSVIVLTPEDLLHSVYLCLNRLAPEYEGIELGIGEMLLMKALAQATGRTVEKIKAEVAVKGDLGLVAESSRGNQRLMFAPPKLTVSSVFTKFKEIAKMSGNTVMSKKTDKIQALFVACRECEAKYIIKSLSGKLRIGLAEQSVLASLSRAAVLTPPNQSYPPEVMDKSSGMGADSFKEYLNAQTLILKTTYCECPNYDLVIPVLLKEGIAGLPEHCQLTAGFPLKPMLAHPTNGINEVLTRFDKNEFTCEFKYDGERAQIHMTDKGEIKIYSRNQENNTSKYPDVISRFSKALKETTKSFILDTEAVAWDCEAKQILPFQVLSTRKKKDAVESDIVVQVCIMAFDLIYLNGESLVKKTLKERRDLLRSAFIEVTNEFMFAIYRDGDSADTMQEFLDESLKGNCEGLMVKALTVDASYEIAKRSHNWLKLKKDYLAGVGDTLDLAVIGGYHGKGKRAGTYGGFLLACHDNDNEEFQSICKLGTGFSDVDLEKHTKFFKEHVIVKPRSYYRYDSSLEPDVWFDAVQVWEIKCADLSISPIHKAAIGIVDPEKGISLRFPRFLRIRDDKTKPEEDTTTSTQIAEMYLKQDQIQNTKKSTLTEEDYY